MESRRKGGEQAEMNKVEFSGRISSEIDFKSGYTDGRHWEIAKFDICVPRTGQGGRNTNRQEEVDYFHVQASGRAAENIHDYGSKGMKVIVTGSMHNNNYRTKKGFQMKSNVIISNEIEYCEAPYLLKLYKETKEGRKFYEEYADKSDAVPTDAPEVADFEIDAELPFG